MDIQGPRIVLRWRWEQGGGVGGLEPQEKQTMRQALRQMATNTRLRSVCAPAAVCCLQAACWPALLRPCRLLYVACCRCPITCMSS